MVVRIRIATPEDVAFIKEMMWEAILVSPVQVRGYGLEKMRTDQENYWNRWLEKPSPVFVAEDEQGQSLGVLTLRGHEDFRREERATGWEMGMGVAPHVRRQGIGQALIRHAIEFCRETKVPFLVLTVDPTNRNAFALYRKMGFKITSKRHYVIEMRVSFEPLLVEDPEIVAKRRYFTQYWPNKKYFANRYRLHHCAPNHVESNSFKRLGFKPRDFVYVVTVIKGGLHLIVKYEVGELLTSEELKKKYPNYENFNPDLDHLLTRRATLYSFEPPIEAEAIQGLQLIEKGKPKPFPFKSDGSLDGHSLRGIREITVESARILDDFVEQFRYL